MEWAENPKLLGFVHKICGNHFARELNKRQIHLTMHLNQHILLKFLKEYLSKDKWDVQDIQIIQGREKLQMLFMKILRKYYKIDKIFIKAIKSLYLKLYILVTIEIYIYI